MNSFEEQDYSSEKFSAGIWKKIFKVVLKRKKHLILMIIFVVGLACMDIVYPLLNKYAIDQFFTKKDFSTVKLFVIGYILIAIGYGVTVWGFIKMAGVVEARVGYEIRSEAFNNLQKLPFSYFDKTPAGWIMARLTSDSRRLADIISWGLVDMLWGSFTMIGMLIVMFVVEWRLALIIVALIPILVIVSIYFRKKILANYRSVRKINSKITGSYNEGILGSKTTKTLVLENTRNDEFDKLCGKMKKSSIRAITYSALFFPILLVISYVAVAIILRVGGGMIIGRVEALIGVSTLYLFINCTTQFFDPIMQIARILADFQQAQASAERVMSLIEMVPEIQDSKEVIEKYGTFENPKKENWEKLDGDIEFRDVSFSYTGKEDVLKKFNLKIDKGTSVAIVGPTGAGKSTIVNLICRFYEPTEGEILIDGRNYKERSISWLHSNLGYVLQSPHLFNESIKDNIRYGNLDATMDDVIRASKAVNAHEFIEKLPNGYDTIVGEGGSKLSTGQKQLISFARAIIADPKILILDEATSSIDTKTEEVVQEVTQKLLKGRTSFIVAHRLSTIQNADIILVVKNGEVIEKGSHAELLKLKGEYYELYKNQFINEGIEKSKK